MNRVVFPKQVHTLLLRLQRGICARCGRPISPFHCSVDHVIPASLGGPDLFGNFVAMHGWCNREKADALPNGCELIWLLAVNARLGVGPQTMRAAA